MRKMTFQIGSKFEGGERQRQDQLFQRAMERVRNASSAPLAPVPMRTPHRHPSRFQARLAALSSAA